MISEDLDHISTVQFDIADNSLAQPFIEKGVYLLHCFAYKEAREAFKKARMIDSTDVLAYWGEAMSYNQSYWQIQDLPSARSVLNMLASTPEERSIKCSNDLERDLLSSLELLFGSDTKFNRDIAYSDFLKKLTRKYPDHIEIASLYCLSLLGSPHYDRKKNVYQECRQLSKKKLALDPGHPGLLHYALLSHDTRSKSLDILAFANDFMRIVPPSPHAEHIPSHIQLFHGLWNDVINTNIRSWNASMTSQLEVGSEDDKRSYHALQWLEYGLLQIGDEEGAKNLLQKMQQYHSSFPSKSTRSHLLALTSAYVVETNQYKDEIANIELYAGDLRLTDRAGYAYLQALKAYHNKKTAELDEWTDKVDSYRIRAKNFLVEDGLSMCLPVGYFNRPTSQLDIDMVRVMEDQLMAMRCMIRNDQKGAEEWLKKAIQLESELEYPLGPPVIYKPSNELLGEWHLQNNNPQAALIAFQESLDLHPGRRLSLQGLLNAAKAIGQDHLIRKANEKLALSHYTSDHSNWKDLQFH